MPLVARDVLALADKPQVPYFSLAASPSRMIEECRSTDIVALCSMKAPLLVIFYSFGSTIFYFIFASLAALLLSGAVDPSDLDDWTSEVESVWIYDTVLVAVVVLVWIAATIHITSGLRTYMYLSLQGEETSHAFLRIVLSISILVIWMGIGMSALLFSRSLIGFVFSLGVLLPVTAVCAVHVFESSANGGLAMRVEKRILEFNKRRRLMQGNDAN